MIWGARVKMEETRIIHSHEMDELVVCQSGSGRHRVGDEVVAFERGRTLYLPGGLIHGVVASPEDPAEILFLCFTHAEITALMPGPLEGVVAELRQEGRYVSLQALSGAVELASQALAELNSPSATSQAMAGSLLSQLLLLHARGFAAPEGRRPKNEEKIAACCRLITARWRETYRLEELARDAGICRSLFCRLFRQQTGMTLTQYILAVRIRVAMRLLNEPEASITQVALNSGFSNLSHFHREFKKQTHMTPRHYRNLVIKQGIVPRLQFRENKCL